MLEDECGLLEEWKLLRTAGQGFPPISRNSPNPHNKDLSKILLWIWKGEEKKNYCEICLESFPQVYKEKEFAGILSQLGKGVFLTPASLSAIKLGNFVLLNLKKTN